MFKMTDLIILAEQFTFFLDGPFFHRSGNMAPSFSKLEWILVSQCRIKLIVCTCNNYEQPIKSKWIMGGGVATS